MISSYGIILFTVQDNKKRFLIGKRADSLEYLDAFNNRCPLEKVKMYTKMSNLFERKKLLRGNFEEIYYDSFSEYRDRDDVLNRWLLIKDLVFQAFEEGGLLESNQNQYIIPKGRKKQIESPEQAAVREFEEETRIPVKNLTKAFYPPYTDKYIGSDDKSYKTVYFVYKTEHPFIPTKILSPSLIPSRKYKISFEIEELYWVTAEEAKEYLSDSLVKILESLN